MLEVLSMENDGFISVLTIPEEAEGLIDLYFKFTGYNLNRCFIFKDIVQSPENLNDMIFVELKDIPEVYKFLKDEKEDLYEELKYKIEKVYEKCQW